MKMSLSNFENIYNFRWTLVAVQDYITGQVIFLHCILEQAF